MLLIKSKLVTSKRSSMYILRNYVRNFLFVIPFSKIFKRRSQGQFCMDLNFFNSQLRRFSTPHRCAPHPKKGHLQSTLTRRGMKVGGTGNVNGMLIFP